MSRLRGPGSVNAYIWTGNAEPGLPAVQMVSTYTRLPPLHQDRRTVQPVGSRSVLMTIVICFSFSLNKDLCEAFVLCSSDLKSSSLWFSDVDECQQDPCHSNAFCSNVQGSYACQCHPGFHGDGFQCSPTPIGRKRSFREKQPCGSVQT